MHMEILEKIRNDSRLREFFLNVCDFDIYNEPREPDNINGEITFSQPCIAFAVCGDGSEFLLIEDGTVGFMNHDGLCGRIAESIDEFISLLVNFPCFYDFLYLSVFREENRESVMKNVCVEYWEIMEDWAEEARYVYDVLAIDKDMDIWNGTMKLLYNAAVREPLFEYYCRGEFQGGILSDNDPWWI